MRILVTSFEPFGGDAENASAQAMRALLTRWSRPDVELVGVELPCVFDDGPLALACTQYHPDKVLCIGEAGMRRRITPERRAINEATARIPDNAGQQPEGAVIVEDGPAERAATIDADDATAALRRAGWAAATSDDAGRFVCNWTAYLAYGLDVPALFVHVPALRSAGLAGVGAETDDGAHNDAPAGREPRSFEDLAAALEVLVNEIVHA